MHVLFSHSLAGIKDDHASDSPAPAIQASGIDSRRQEVTIIPSRRTKAVETTWIIRPLRIVKIGRAAGEGVGLKWQPIGRN